MDDLMAFLRARLDEDGKVAREAAAVRGPEWWYDPGPDGQVLAGCTLDGGNALVRALAMTARSDAEGEHAARHDPARVLREVEAKRRAIGAHVADEKGHCRTCAHWESDWVDGFKVDRLSYEGVRAPCLTLRLLALPFADQPDYREEWRP